MELTVQNQEWTLELDTEISSTIFKVNATIQQPIEIAGLIRITRSLSETQAGLPYFQSMTASTDAQPAGPRFYIDMNQAAVSAAARIQGAFRIDVLQTEGELSVQLSAQKFLAHAYARLLGSIAVELHVEWDWQFTSFHVGGSVGTYGPCSLLTSLLGGKGRREMFSTQR